MRKLVLFMHISLDGYATDKTGGMSWIKIDQEMFDYAFDRTQASDIALYGRNTFEIMEAYWPTAADQPNATKHDIEHAAWYNSVKKLVASKTLKKSPDKNTSIIGENLSDEIRKLKQQEGKEIIMFGSPGTAQSLIKENLIDDFWLFVNPILIGEGQSIFGNPGKPIGLNLISSKAFSSGVVCQHYTTNTEDLS